MRRKPWAIVVLSILHILAPIGNLLVNSYRAHRPLAATWNYWYEVLPKSLFFAYVLAPPLAGIMIFICRRWSYWVYLLCLTWIFIANVYGFWTSMKWFSFFFLLGILLFDFIAVAYFMAPTVRTVYFDPKSRWWESAPRFTFNLEVKINDLGGLIRNVSVGGLFIEAWDGFQQGQEVVVEWDYDRVNFRIPAQIVYKNSRGYGIHFLHTTSTQKQIKHFIRLLEKQGVPVINRSLDSDGFISWVKNLVTKGEGLFPKGR